MQAIREIREVSSRELVLTLPETFLQKHVEIIILTVEEDEIRKIEGENRNKFEQAMAKIADTEPEAYDRL